MFATRSRAEKDWPPKRKRSALLTSDFSSRVGLAGVNVKESKLPQGYKDVNLR
jgi:hypothetical protein